MCNMKTAKFKGGCFNVSHSPYNRESLVGHLNWHLNTSCNTDGFTQLRLCQIGIKWYLKIHSPSTEFIYLPYNIILFIETMLSPFSSWHIAMVLPKIICHLAAAVFLPLPPHPLNVTLLVYYIFHACRTCYWELSNWILYGGQTTCKKDK